MSNKNNKKNSKQKETVQAQKVKLKGEGVGSTLSIVIPIVLIFVFLVGGMILFVFLEESRRLPNQAYLDAEQIVKDGSVIGLTIEECREVIGTFAIIHPTNPEADWIFPAGHKAFRDGEGQRNYELRVSHENGVAVGAELRGID
jgi:hypothetical protein